MNDPLIISYGGSSVEKWGKSAKYDFDNPQKWHTEQSVPLLDEHEMTDDNGKPVARVDRTILEQIAANNNQRVRETGDPATLILGHTSDDPRAEEKPARGFVTNYHVKPFKRDPKTGQVIYAIHGDFKVRPQNKHLLEEYPRRSVELWWHKKELDPIALLGGSSPERDLGVVIRNKRINHISLEGLPRAATVKESMNRYWQQGQPIQFHSRGNYLIERYMIDALPIKKSKGEAMNGKNGKHKVTNVPGNMKYGMDENCDPDDKMQYDDLGMDTDDMNQYDGGDESVPPVNDNDMGGGSEDPMLAKLFQSKQWKELMGLKDQVSQIVQALGIGGEQEQGMDGIGGEQLPPEMPPPQDGMDLPGGGVDPMMQAPPPGAEAMGDDMEPEEDERRMHGEKPVQMNASTGYPGPNDVNIPSTQGKKRPNQMSRNGAQGMTRTRQQQNPEVIRMQRELADMRLKYAKTEAAKIMQDLVAENIRFGRTDEEHQKGIAAHEEHFADVVANGTEQDVAGEIELIRRCYARSRPNPAQPTAVGVARYTRTQVDIPTSQQKQDEDDENFEETLVEPATDQHGPDLRKVQQFAEVQLRYMREHKLSQPEARKAAIKFMRSRAQRVQ